MTDRELEEFAAKAAGYSIYWHHADQSHHIEIGGSDRKWRPLKVDDGDALRLAVDLYMAIDVINDLDVAASVVTSNGSLAFVVEPIGSDKYKAVRCAVVRVAAEIGRGDK